jgi:hypothetical protein
MQADEPSFPDIEEIQTLFQTTQALSQIKALTELEINEEIAASRDSSRILYAKPFAESFIN